VLVTDADGCLRLALRSDLHHAAWPGPSSLRPPSGRRLYW